MGSCPRPHQPRASACRPILQGQRRSDRSLLRRDDGVLSTVCGGGGLWRCGPCGVRGGVGESSGVQESLVVWSLADSRRDVVGYPCCGRVVARQVGLRRCWGMRHWVRSCLTESREGGGGQWRCCEMSSECRRERERSKRVQRTTIRMMRTMVPSALRADHRNLSMGRAPCVYDIRARRAVSTGLSSSARSVVGSAEGGARATPGPARGPSLVSDLHRSETSAFAFVRCR